MNKKLKIKMYNYEKKLLNQKKVTRREYIMYIALKNLDFIINDETYGEYIGWQQEGFYPVGDSYLNETKILLKRENSRF